MPQTAEQLSQALTAEFVAQRTLMEALINRVTSIVTQEQVERLKLQEMIDAIFARLDSLEAAMHAATEQRAHMMTELGALRAEVARTTRPPLREPGP